MIRLTGYALLMVAMAGCGGGSGGALNGFGPEQIQLVDSRRANSFTANDQQRPAVAHNAQGDAVVVWESFGQDGSHFGIFGQRFQQGEPVGDEFPVNTFTTGRQNFNSVAMDANGNFVVVWRSSLQDGPGGTIFGQRFNADGTRAGSEFQIGPGDSEADSQSEPKVAMNPQGDFVVTWSNRRITQLALLLGRNDLEERLVQARAFRADGAPRSAFINVAGPTSDATVRWPGVGIADDGRFVISWISSGTPSGVRARAFAADGAPRSDELSVHVAPGSEAVDFPVIAVGPDGAFAIAWEAYTFGYRPLGAFLRRYTANATPIGDRIRVADPVSLLHERLGMTTDRAGRYFVIGQGEDQIVISGVDVTGRPMAPTPISAAAPSGFGAVAFGANGAGLAAWTTFGEDGDRRGIFVGNLR